MDLHKKFSSLTLHELQNYVLDMERECALLRAEASAAANMIAVLESLTKCCQTGYSTLRRIQINKACDCNEHLNVALRKALNQSVVESNVWLHEYEVLKGGQPLDCHADMSDEMADDGEHGVRREVRLDVRRDVRHSNATDGENVATIANRSDAGVRAVRAVDGVDGVVGVEGLLRVHAHHYTHPTLRPTLRPTLHPLRRRPHPNDKHLNKSTIHRRGRGPGRPPKNETTLLRLSRNEKMDELGESQWSSQSSEDCQRTGGLTGRYACPWPDCQYTPHFLRDLRRHMHKHTGEKQYKCLSPQCNFCTVWKTSLLQHQRKKHHIAHPFVLKNIKQFNS